GAVPSRVAAEPGGGERVPDGRGGGGRAVGRRRRRRRGDRRHGVVDGKRERARGAAAGRRREHRDGRGPRRGDVTRRDRGLQLRAAHERGGAGAAIPPHAGPAHVVRPIHGQGEGGGADGRGARRERAERRRRIGRDDVDREGQRVGVAAAGGRREHADRGGPGRRDVGGRDRRPKLGGTH